MSEAESWVSSDQFDDVLIVAPPGCGKTQLLAERARSVVAQGIMRPHQQVLAVTFSNKARANLAARAKSLLGSGYVRSVCVTNFHSFGARLAQHHGHLVGRTVAATAATRTPFRSLLRSVAETHSADVNELSELIRTAKQGPFSDDEVLEHLSLSPAALEYENRLREAGLIDFDDMLRIGLLVLQIPAAVNAYRNRFPCVLVDETQDLSLVQFRLIDELGRGRTAFAGDRAQGIYGFAGAAPAEIYEKVESRAAQVIELDTSYRSAPNIVSLVSEISGRLSGVTVRPADGLEWLHDGRVVVEQFANPTEESRWVVEMVSNWLAEDPTATIGVIVRSGYRRATLDKALRANNCDVYFWDRPAHKPGVATLVRQHANEALVPGVSLSDALDALFLRCASAAGDDLDILEDLREALEDLEETASEIGLREAVETMRVQDDLATPTPPGCHLLNAHRGKGQQFDYLVVLGMEEGHIPDYRAVTASEKAEERSAFHVMVSRARHTLVLTVCRDVPFNGRPWFREPSHYLKLVADFETGW